MTPLVSVVITTYNHEKFISQAIDSVLAQQTNFSFELLIGEDESSDTTRQIAKDYANRFPDTIRLFLNERKNVISISGHPTGRWNMLNLLSNARGKYIAILDGDDFWTAGDKLQSQVNFLEANHDYAFCFHDVECVDEEGKSTKFQYCAKELAPGDIEQFRLFERCITQIGSVLFRASSITPPHRADTIRSYDWFLYILASESGKFHYSKKVASAYRLHPGGVWQGMSYLKMLEGEVDSLRRINEYFDSKYDKYILPQITRLELEISIRSKVSEELDFLRSQLSSRNEELAFIHGELARLRDELEQLRSRRAFVLYLKLRSIVERFANLFRWNFRA